MSWPFDGCIPRQVAEALHIVSYDVWHVQTVPELAGDADDAELIGWRKDHGAVLGQPTTKSKKRDDMQNC